MKKNFGSLISVLLAFALLVSAFVLNISADGDETTPNETSNEASAQEEFVIPDDPDSAPVTMGFLFNYLEQYKKEILAEIGANGGNGSNSGYSDVTLNAGQTIILSADSEVIFRGGNAIAITSAFEKGEGLVDLSDHSEIFSGEALKAGHIYTPGSSDAKKAIIVTGQSAYFTLKGTYEIV